MGHWGWRPLVLCLFVCVLVFGCAEHRTPAPATSPVDQPPVTLTVRLAQRSTATAPGIPTRIARALPSPTRTASASRTSGPAATPTPLAVSVSTPVCYETPVGGLLCLGSVSNPGPQPLESVIVYVQVYRDDAVPLQAAQVALPQRRLPAESRAPYRAVFPPVDDLYLSDVFGFANARVIRAEPAAEPDQPAIIFQETSAGYADRHYQLRGTLINEASQQVADVQLTITLYDNTGRVVGYRTVAVPTLDPDQSLPLTVAITPAYPATAIQHTVHIEAARR
ncbi:MAG: FxLYD domain-containing protein [Chloroflexota bacterium]